MRKLSTWRIVRTTYNYDDEQERDMHKETMSKRGYDIVPKRIVPIYIQNDLVVTYETREYVDNIERL